MELLTKKIILAFYIFFHLTKMNKTNQISMNKTFTHNFFKNFKSTEEIPRPSSSNSRKISLNFPETTKKLPPILEIKNKLRPFTARPIDSPLDNDFNKQISPWGDKQKNYQISEKAIFKELFENFDHKTNPIIYRKIKELESCIEEKNKLSNFRNSIQQGKYKN